MFVGNKSLYYIRNFVGSMTEFGGNLFYEALPTKLSVDN